MDRTAHRRTPGQNDLLTLKLYWDITSRILFQLGSPFFKKFSKRTAWKSIACQPRLTCMRMAVFDPSQPRAHSSAYIDVASYYVRQQKNKLRPGSNTARTP